jgi:hypothetical protein
MLGNDAGMFKETLINSESLSCVGKMCQIKAPIAGNSRAIAKIGNAELAHFTKQMLIHELIRGSFILNLRDFTINPRVNTTDKNAPPALK